jgi:hypothetical protein
MYESQLYAHVTCEEELALNFWMNVEGLLNGRPRLPAFARTEAVSRQVMSVVSILFCAIVRISRSVVLALSKERSSGKVSDLGHIMERSGKNHT